MQLKTLNNKVCLTALLAVLIRSAMVPFINACLELRNYSNKLNFVVCSNMKNQTMEKIYVYILKTSLTVQQ